MSGVLPDIPPPIDLNLKKYATPSQAKYIDTLFECGSYSAAAAKLGVHKSAVGQAVRAVKMKAARAGYAPGHFTDGVAPGYQMGKVTVQRGPGGVERVWERQHPEAARQQEAMQAAIDAMREEIPRLAPIKPPAGSLTALANLYTITDFHLGMYAWAKEGGDDWNLEIAEKTLLASFSHMFTTAPPARKAIINIQGDFLHTDGPEAITPTHGHQLDASGRYSEMVAVAVRVLRRVCDLALLCHAEVEVLFVEGNHDLRGSMWLRHLFGALYESEPRLTVNDSELPYYAIQWGKVMLAFHHGHISKNESLPLLFAAQFPSVWGATLKRYAHTGHQHHAEEKEHSGMRVMRHQTLAPRDAHAARGGWMAERAADCITYHADFGQVARTTVTPEMLT
jgi:hypothetical protein